MKKILVTAAVMLLGFMSLQAEGTAAGTSISNSATLNYEVGGVGQTQVNTTTPDVFLVDRKVDFILTNDDGNQVSTTPGQNDVNTTWTLVNEGNADQNFTLVSSELVTGTVVYGNADTNDTTGRDILYSTDGGTTWVAYTTQIEIAPDANITIRVASDIAVALSNGDVMNIDLVATAVTAAGATEANTAGGDTQGSVDTVLADGSTDAELGANGDGTSDAIYTAQGGYIIETAVLAVVKSSCVLDDPVNGTTNPKRIPGATIWYQLEVTNTGTVAAANVEVSDTLNAAFGTSATNIEVHNGACPALTANNNCGARSGAAEGNTHTGAGTSNVTVNFEDIGATGSGTDIQCGYIEVVIE